MSLAVAAEIVNSALLLYRAALPAFFWRVLPLFVLSLAIEPLSGTTETYGSALSAVLSFVIETIAGAFALASLLRTQFPGLEIAVSVRSVCRFVVVELYVALVTGLALLLLVLPAFWVASVVFLSPVFALAHGQGPIAAVASSAEATKGHLRLIVLLVVFSLLLFIVGLVTAHFLPAPIDYLGSLAFSVIWLYEYALVVVVFARLHPNPAVNTDLAHKAAQGRLPPRWAS